MYTALYRKYRPGTFDEMAGQEHIIRILKNQINTGQTAHAYLFCGTRGTGKTSAARIFAKGVNCLSEGNKPCGHCENCESIQHGTFFDVIEIDAASNNGVENIRELRESVKYPPAAGLCKVYIIDEVHMLSQGAFNALLKTLEEPPAHVIFILATTEPHKLPATILSRCLRLDFRRVPEPEIIGKLKEICEELKIDYEDSALSLIAANGDGSVRDSLSILEQCIPLEEKALKRNTVIEVLGTAGEEAFLTLTEYVAKGETAEALLYLDRISQEGKDLRQFIKDWIFHFRNLMMSRYGSRLEQIMDMSCENVEKVKAQGQTLKDHFVFTAIEELSKTVNQMRWSKQPRTLIEMSILKLSMPELNDSQEALMLRIEKLEEEISRKGPVKKEIPLPVQTLVREKKEEKPVEGKEEKELLEDLEAKRIWDIVFEKASVQKSSLNMLKGSVMALEIEEDALVLQANSKVKGEYLNQNKELLETILSEYMKKGMHLKIILNYEEKEIDRKETIKKIEGLLGSEKLKIIKE